MKALVKSRPESGIWMENVPVPATGHNEVLIQIEKTGIRGSDAHIYNWDEWARRNIHVPRVLGHEFVGKIVDIGPGVEGFQIRDRVTAEGHITCGIRCNYRAGGQSMAGDDDVSLE